MNNINLFEATNIYLLVVAIIALIFAILYFADRLDRKSDKK